jgi:CRP-like cAMP-binding protein
MSVEPRPNLFQHDSGAEVKQAGQVIFAAGDAPGDLMYAVAEGEVDIQLNGVTVETVGPGGFFGEIALIDHQPRSATVVARTDARVVAITPRRFTFLVQQNPYFALEVMRTMVARIRRLSASR